MAMYLWSAALYLMQVALVVRQLPRIGGGQERSDRGMSSSG
jgi:hypothetical protein